MILCSKLKNGLCKIVTKSQVVTKFNVTKSRLHCSHVMQYVYTNIFYQNHCLTVVPKSQGDIQSILDTYYLENFTSIAVESEKARERVGEAKDL